MMLVKEKKHSISKKHIGKKESFEKTGCDPYLYNEDLAPTTKEQRTWGTYNYTALWIGMAHCIPTYTLASGLIAAGMNWWQALATILLGNIIVLAPMLLNSYAGTKYGIPFPVLCRSAFGVFGANVPALMRAFVACAWFGIQTWIGGEAIHKLLSASFSQWPSWGIWIAFFAFWLVNMWVIWKGMASVRYFEGWAAPFVLVVTVGLLIWMVQKANGFGPILAEPGRLNSLETFLPVFIPSLTAMIGFWSTLSLNMPDFTRYAKGQTEQIVGQTLGLPTTMVFFAGLGVMITSATTVVFGSPIWDPLELMAKFNHPIIVIFSLFTIAVATLSVNVAANVVSPAFDFSNLWPKKINFAIGGTITGIIGIAMCPWLLMKNFSTYFQYLTFYAGILGAIGGVMVSDFFIVRKRTLNINQLYRTDSTYGKWNKKALFSLVCGIAIASIGWFIPADSNITLVAIAKIMKDASWFAGFIASFLLYWLSMKKQH